MGRRVWFFKGFLMKPFKLHVLFIAFSLCTSKVFQQRDQVLELTMGKLRNLCPGPSP